MESIVIAAFLLTSAVFGADLTFVADANCTGQALYGRKDLPSVPCYDMSYLDPTKSVVLANLNPGEKISFFSDTACQNELYSSSISVCYTEPDSQVRSFQVQTNDTPEDAATSTTDMVPYGIRPSNYKCLSQTTIESPDIMLVSLLSVSSLVWRLNWWRWLPWQLDAPQLTRRTYYRCTVLLQVL